MDSIYEQEFTVTDLVVDRYGRLKLSALLYYAQEVAGQHSALLGADFDTLAQKRLFWAVTRHKVQIDRLPRRGETVRVQTWPMPTTKVGYPRAMAIYAADGTQLLRSISLWVLMDPESRSMVLPGRSGVEVAGVVRGNELAVPHSLIPRTAENSLERQVTYSCLDRNGHMNNTRYLDWVEDLLPSDFHSAREAKELTVCYANEALEGQTLRLDWSLSPEGCLQVDGHRTQTDESAKQTRIFAAAVVY